MSSKHTGPQSIQTITATTLVSKVHNQGALSTYHSASSQASLTTTAFLIRKVCSNRQAIIF